MGYQAKLVAGAAQAGTAGTARTFATLAYTASPDSDETAETTQDEADLLTWALVLSKVDEQDEALEGAVFTVCNAAGLYVAADGTLVEDAAELATDADGLISIVGLDSGVYTFEEVTAPSGYTAIEAFTITISATLDDEVSLSALPSSTDVEIQDVDAESGTVSARVVGAASGALGNALAQTGQALGFTLVALVVAVIALAAFFAVRRARTRERQ